MLNRAILVFVVVLLATNAGSACCCISLRKELDQAQALNLSLATSLSALREERDNLNSMLHAYQEMCTFLHVVADDDPEASAPTLKREVERLEDELRAFREATSNTLHVDSTGKVDRGAGKSKNQ